MRGAMHRSRDSAGRCACGDELDHHARRWCDKQLALAGVGHRGRSVFKVVRLQKRDQLVPFRFTVNPERNVIDAGRYPGGRMIRIALDQMDDGFAVVIQPMAVEGERRTFALGQTDDVAEEMPHGFQVRRGDGSVIEFHDVILRLAGKLADGGSAAKITDAFGHHRRAQDHHHQQGQFHMNDDAQSAILRVA